MVVNLKRSQCHVTSSSLRSSSSGYDLNSLNPSAAHYHCGILCGTVRHFGLKNGKYCVCKWVQSATMNEKIQNLLLQLLRWQMAESCSHSFTFHSRMCASLHCLAACSHQTQTADEWLQPASEASLVCLDCVVTRIKEGQVSIISTDMGH